MCFGQDKPRRRKPAQQGQGGAGTDANDEDRGVSDASLVSQLLDQGSHRQSPMRGGMKGPGSWESGQFRRRQAALPVHRAGPMAPGYGLIQRQVAPGHALRVVQAAFPLLPMADLSRSEEHTSELQSLM